MTDKRPCIYCNKNEEAHEDGECWGYAPRSMPADMQPQHSQEELEFLADQAVKKITGQ